MRNFHYYLRQFVRSKPKTFASRCGLRATLWYFLYRLIVYRVKATLNKPGISERLYKGADKSLARQGRKQANVSVRMAWISFSALPCRKKKLDDSSRLDFTEIARVPDMLPSCFFPGRAKDLSAPRQYTNKDKFWIIMENEVRYQWPECSVLNSWVPTPSLFVKHLTLPTVSTSWGRCTCANIGHLSVLAKRDTN